MNRYYKVCVARLTKHHAQRLKRSFHFAGENYEELSRQNRDLKIRLQHLTSLLSEQSKIINLQQTCPSRMAHQDALIQDLQHTISQLTSELSICKAERDSLQFIVDELKRRVRNSLEDVKHKEQPSNALSKSQSVSPVNGAGTRYSHDSNSSHGRMFDRPLRDDDSWVFARTNHSTSPKRNMCMDYRQQMNEEQSMLNDTADELAMFLRENLDTQRHVESSFNDMLHLPPTMPVEVPDNHLDDESINGYLPPLPKATSLSPGALLRDMSICPRSPDRLSEEHWLHNELNKRTVETSIDHINADDHVAWKDRALRLETERNALEEELLQRYSDLRLREAEERMKKKVAEPDATSISIDDIAVRTPSETQNIITWAVPSGAKSQQSKYR